MVKQSLTPLHLGALTLKNRLIMAPLTRMRAAMPGNIPHALNATYYGQRATAGLIVAEATQISPQGQGYPATPGIYSPAQVAGWRLVTNEVHQKGGLMFLQLWHVGRISHSSYHGGKPVAPSEIAPSGKTFTADWQQVPYETPHALTVEEIKATIADYRAAAQNAKEAGFDGVEIHAANGYLIDQFLQDGTNKRTDNYGGSVENRSRLLFEVLSAVATVWPKERIGVRLSPYGTFNDMHDSDPMALFGHVISRLSDEGIGYLHLIEPRSTGAGGGDALMADAPETAKLFRSKFKGILISAGGHTPESAEEYLQQGLCDAVAFGRYFISTPDLPERIRQGVPLNAYDRSTFYGGGEKGYTDYPTLAEQQKAVG